MLLLFFPSCTFCFFASVRRLPSSTLFPYTTLFRSRHRPAVQRRRARRTQWVRWHVLAGRACQTRSEEHTSELQSPCNLVCRLLLEKKKIEKEQTFKWKRDIKPANIKHDKMC